MISGRVQRINELARKQKSVGLTAEEKLEQAELRKQYIDNLKASLRQQLDSIEFVDDEEKKD
ncbi:DUF896 domain-containing protein [Paenibacillus antri]|uniref:UPF0291 protein FE782_20975 n=1 Tax=Paenibacillus antri TaxID=2582848 RepID=A0A5R9G7U9_9BACL|nr:DUF896 domain-containing protein [Paenibacillus antri]TLS50150.1 DUF896 domain-containing protein [Paenibacillus antri]